MSVVNFCDIIDQWFSVEVVKIKVEILLVDSEAFEE
jgi:hypothetical protein